MSLIDPVAPSIPPVMAETASEPTQQAVAVVGLGYVGLPTALGCHAAGMSVIGVDVSQERVGEILAGSPDLLDADLALLELARGDTDHFAVVGDVAAIAKAACVLICVPTPIDERQTPNLAPLSKACEAVVAHARAGQVVVLTSTTYVGCTRDLLVDPLAARGLMAGQDVYVCFAPERIDPANTRLCDDRCAEGRRRRNRSVRDGRGAVPGGARQPAACRLFPRGGGDDEAAREYISGGEYHARQ